MKMRIGLGGRLLLAFLAIAGLPALAGVWGWVELSRVAATQSRMIDGTLPAAAEVRVIAEESARIAALAPELAGVETQSEREASAAYLRAQVAALSGRLEQFQPQSYRATQLESLRNTVSRIGSDLRRLNQAVTQRLFHRESLDGKVLRGQKAVSGLLGLSETLVANAQMRVTAVISSLYEQLGPGDGTEDARLRTLDKLIEVDLFDVEQMVGLRTRAAELGQILSQLEAAETPEEITALRERFAAALAIVHRRAATIKDPVRAKLAREYVTELVDVTREGEPTVFELRTGLLEALTEISQLQQDERLLSEQMVQQSVRLVEFVEASARQAGEQAEAAVQGALTRLALAAALAVAVSLGVFWFYVRRHVIGRVNQLAGGMAQLAEGDLTLKIVPRGDDEIARMERAVLVFRDHEIAKRELEVEQERNRRALVRHRNELQDLVKARTAALSGEVEAHALARREAESANRAKSEFLAMMSHEIRTPMHGVLGLLRVLADEEPSSDRQELAKAAFGSASNLLAILNDILDYSKIEAGRIDVEEADFDPHALVREVGALMRPVAQNTGLNLIVDHGREVPHVLRGDVGKVRQILINLVSNALKFTSEGEVVLRSRSGSANGDWHTLFFEVSDSGIGIPEEQKAAIFEAFEQAGSFSSRQFGGAGLGLAISRRLAEAMGGRLEVESSDGVGSVFTLTVPMACGNELWNPSSTGERDVPAAGGKLDVLVLEDNKINQMVAENYLARMGHRTVCAGTGAEALQRLAQHRYDVILLDINLPGIDGIETARQIRALPRRDRAEMLIIAMSAQLFEDDFDKVFEAGVDAFLAKPVSPERLARALQRVQAGEKRMVIKSQRDEPRVSPQNMAFLEILSQDRAVLGPERARHILDLFLVQSAPTAEEMLAAARRGDLSAAGALAHRLKSSVDNFRLDELSDLLRRVEAATKAGQRDAVQRMAEWVPVTLAAASAALLTAWAQLDQAEDQGAETVLDHSTTAAKT